jgi:hypothetical protein
MKNIRFTTDEINEKVLAILKEIKPTPEKRLTKEIISIRVFGYYNPTTDRKVRDAVEELRNREPAEPICSTPGVAGYAYGWDYIMETIADYRARGSEDFKTAGHLESGFYRYQHEEKMKALKKNEPVSGSVQIGLF